MTDVHTELPPRRRALLGALLLTACLASGEVLAEPSADFPSKPIQLLVAAPPGGASDAFARQFADEFSKVVGQPVIVDNRPGAGGNIAATLLTRAPRDGHTLMLSWMGNATNQTLMPDQSFDINRDFVHIAQLGAGCNVLVSRQDLGFKTLADLVAHARANPGRLTYGSSGNGSSGHLSMEMLRQRAGISLLHVPYKGGAPALTDLLGGQVQVMFLNQDSVIPYVRDGKLVPLAVTSAQRNPLFPAVPTVAEQGYPGFEVTAWSGLSAPRGTPEAVVQALHKAAIAAVSSPRFRAQQEAIGAQVVGSSQSEYTAFVRAETEKWAGVIKSAGIKAQ
ncbi:Tripartite-type tricarboxylate transporter, receptor component TctC [Variovorax sp. HW608]|uniref:Bug family tripartite tricarboxylate transporter substrate binding protein n=1 Tax=Variovorax sp. HW608 TaxID=1034889 RepID=UPI0008201B71|nr:tripartite tricarboxylate transporter substrate binding protein [Variovorax sp. HW608]SCK09881.1 Tripartite-type tricarboxylate transporter, receptor component TctC [Variovorax sp. HW608]